MATRPIRVWSGSDWEDVAIAPFDSGEFITAATASATYLTQSNASAEYLAADTASATYATQSSYAPLGRNLIINGAMQVHQRGTSSTGITTGGYRTADRFNWGISSLGHWTHSVENDAPTGSGLRKSFKALCTTAKAAPDANNFVLFQQQFEGQDLQRIRKGTADAQQLTLSFWVKSNVTGTFIVELDDVDNTRSCNISYSVAAADTWERKVITFPADTTGPFDNDNAASLRCSFWLGSGSTFTSGTLQTTWGSTTSANRNVGGTNLAAATNNYWQVTGVQLETGPVATPFEFEPYEATLRKCQRYYYLHAAGNPDPIGMGSNFNAGNMRCYVHFPTTMRAEPSVEATSGTDYYDFSRDNASDTFNSLALVSGLAGVNGATIANTSEISGTSGQAGVVYANNNSAKLAFSSEL